MDLIWSLPVFFLIVVLLIAIAPLFIWIHVRAIRFKIEGYLRYLYDKEGKR